MTDRTPEQLGKETGEALGFAIANGLESIFMRLADAIATLQAEQAEIRDAMVELARNDNQAAGILVKHGERLDLLERGQLLG
jgi:hypothetical protein